MEKQEVKIEYNNTQIFFFQHSFKTAKQHASDFIKRNINKYDMKVYTNVGEKWILEKTFKKVEV